MFFWLIFLAVIFLCFANYRIGGRIKPKVFNTIGFVILLFLTSFRFDIGWDYPNYFQTIWPTINLETLSILEPGSQGIVLLAYYLGSPIYIFVIYSLLTLLLVYISFVRFSKSFFISFLIYLSFFYLSSLSTIRQGLALAIIIFCIHYLLHHNYLKYIIGCIIASLFHSSALVALFFIPLYILSNRKTLLPLFIISSVSLFLLFKVAVSIIFPQYLSYISNANQYSGGSLVMIFMAIFVVSLSFIVYRYGCTVDYKLLIIPLIGCILPFLFGSHIGGRIQNYFIIPICFIIPNLLTNQKANKIFRYLVMIFVVYFLSTILIDSRNSIKSQFTPYKTVFNQNLNSPKFK